MTPATTFVTSSIPGMRLVIDWSAAATVPSAVRAEADRLVDWVRSHPQRRSVHVYLRRSPVTRQLQSTLQALGCTVTTTIAGPHSYRR